MMPGANCLNEATLIESFQFTNVTPHRAAFNLELLGFERFERNVAKVNDQVSCVMGNIYDGSSEVRDVPGIPKLKLPSHVFKILVIENEGEERVLLPFCMEHVEFGQHWSHSMTTVEEIEKMAGVRFFTPRDHTYAWDASVTTIFCQKCRIYVLEKEIIEHRRIHPQIYSCPRGHCRQKFESPEDLREHLQEYHGLFLCTFEDCNTATKTKKEMDKHYSYRHSRDRKYHCGHCPERFSSPQAKCNHQRLIHGSVADNYPCPEPGCPRLFMRPSELREHQFKHSKVQPFKCWLKGCEKHKRFSAKRSLKRHFLRTHNMEQKQADELTQDLQPLKDAVDALEKYLEQLETGSD